VTRDWPRTGFGLWVGLILDMDQHNKKNIYYHSFKTWLGGSTRVKAWVTGQEGQLGLIRVNIKIQVVIVIVLKLDPGVYQGQWWCHGSGELTRVDLGQHKNKNCYCHSFKTSFWGKLGQCPSHRFGGST
jgi:hypothetical protein